MRFGTSEQYISHDQKGFSGFVFNNCRARIRCSLPLEALLLISLRESCCLLHKKTLYSPSLRSCVRQLPTVTSESTRLLKKILIDSDPPAFRYICHSHHIVDQCSSVGFTLPIHVRKAILPPSPESENGR